RRVSPRGGGGGRPARTGGAPAPPPPRGARRGWGPGGPPRFMAAPAYGEDGDNRRGAEERTTARDGRGGFGVLGHVCDIRAIGPTFARIGRPHRSRARRYRPSSLSSDGECGNGRPPCQGRPVTTA